MSGVAYSSELQTSIVIQKEKKQNMFLHYDKRGHRGLFYLHIHRPAALNTHWFTESADENSTQKNTLFNSDLNNIS